MTRFARNRNYPLVGGLCLLLLTILLAACGDATATSVPNTPTATTAVATAAAVTSAAASPTTTLIATKPGVVPGATQRLGNGLVQSWLKMDEAGKPQAIGFTFSEQAMNGLPPTSESTVVALPDQAITLTPFNHLSIDWNPNGHDPAPVYGNPHFDFHFYILTPQERKAIVPNSPEVDAKGAKQAAPEFIPASNMYIPGPPVPGMGTHLVDKSAPEANGQPFTKTFTYGFYNAKMAFLEPMITKAFLESRPNTTDGLMLPQSYQKTGVYYPTKYSVKYDANSKEYTIALESLTLR